MLVFSYLLIKRAKSPSTHSTLPEFHFVTCKSSSFVTEDELDLAKLFYELRRPTDRGSVSDWVIHFYVVFYKVG